VYLFGTKLAFVENLLLTARELLTPLLLSTDFKLFRELFLTRFLSTVKFLPFYAPFLEPWEALLGGFGGLKTFFWFET